MSSTETTRPSHSASTRPSSSTIRPSATRSTTTLGTADTLLRSLSRSDRPGWWLILIVALVLVVATLPYARSDRTQLAAIIGVVVLAICLGAAGWLRRRQVADSASVAVAGLAAAASLPIVLLYGVGGPTSGFVVLGLLMYSINATARRALVVTCVVAVPHLLLHALMVFRIVEPVGMIVPLGHYIPGEIASLQAVPFVYVLAVVLGQIFRRQTTKDLERLAEVGREVAAREVLLREARRELEQAAGVGQPGRFTGQPLGSFTLGNILGRGGMGEIYEATQDDGTPAAVKLLRPLVGDPGDLLKRFERESSVLAQLDSPFLVRVLEVGGMEAELPYIGMERLYGADLASILREKRTLEPKAVAELLEHIAKGLAATAAKQIVHRDIKPPNLFRTNDGQWKVLDFGVARLAGSSRTLTGTKLVGTPSYMAPEQVLEDGHIDHRTDIYALGIVAYRALTGRPAYSGKDLGVMLEQIAEELPTRPSKSAPVGVEVDEVLRIALAKSPDHRFQSATEFAQCFAAAIRGEPDPRVAAHALELNRMRTWASA